MPVDEDRAAHSRALTATDALRGLLEFGISRSLPPLVWTVHGANSRPEVSGHCDGLGQEKRLEAWCCALRSLLGPEDPDHGSGARAFIFWPEFMGCAVMLDGEREAP